MNSACMKLSQISHAGGEHSHCKALQAGLLKAKKSSTTLPHFRVPLSPALPARSCRDELQNVRGPLVSCLPVSGDTGGVLIWS